MIHDDDLANSCLEHLIRAHADDVQPDDLLVVARADEFHRGLGLGRRLDLPRAVPEHRRRGRVGRGRAIVIAVRAAPRDEENDSRTNGS